MSQKDWVKMLRWGLFLVEGKWCAVAWTSKGLSALVLPQQRKGKALQKLHQYLPPLQAGFWERSEAKVPDGFQKSIRTALRGKQVPHRSFDLPFLTPFQQRVLRATYQIPWGEVRSYGWVARRALSPSGFRAAGQALNRNPIPLFIPCHRVIAGGNRLGGYGGGIAWKIKLLKMEGVRVKEGIVS